jgi:CheY-like chemotaxis protein
MNTLSVLVVEDEALIRLSIIMMLRSLGATISGEASSGEEAVALAHSSRPDLVLMDVKLAGAMNGVEAASRILSGPGPFLVFMSAYEEADLGIPSVERVLGFCPKPLGRSALEFMLEKADGKLRPDA